MLENGRIYSLIIGLNGRRFKRVLIDPHYETKDFDITDELILNLVRLMNGLELKADDEKEEFNYFEKTLIWNGKFYRIIFTLCRADFIGVVNAFRVDKEKL
jgi:hypothetical protein